MRWIEIPAKFLNKDTDAIQLVKLPGKSFCLVYYEGCFVAFSRKCPHAGAPFEQGWRDGDHIVCSYHRQRFDLRTGRGEIGQGNYIDIYPTKCEENRWYIGIRPSFWEKLLG
ncbi:MAG TPA: Rieske (2Fe-2S) protein [Sphingobacterium sp.]|nr:Rieske (2Fe-2S) protein [Sphingobacterium sp.]